MSRRVILPYIITLIRGRQAGPAARTDLLRHFPVRLISS